MNISTFRAAVNGGTQENFTRARASATSENSIITEVVPTQAGYDRWAEVYDAEDNPLIRLEERHLGALLGELSGQAVLDVGCGTGRHALRLATAGAKVTGVDFSSAMLGRARSKPGAETIRFVEHDLRQSLPFPARAFDRVLCSLVLDHIPDLDRLFTEFKRVCRLEGPVVVSVMHPAMLLQGVQARFIDPATGQRVGPASCPHVVSDYVMASIRAGLTLEHISEYAVDQQLADDSPRARRYLGWPLLLLMRMRVL